jgi:hypothetical protein
MISDFALAVCHVNSGGMMSESLAMHGSGLELAMRDGHDRVLHCPLPFAGSLFGKGSKSSSTSPSCHQTSSSILSRSWAGACATQYQRSLVSSASDCIIWLLWREKGAHSSLGHGFQFALVCSRLFAQIVSCP